MMMHEPWEVERYDDTWFDIADRFGGSVAEAIPNAEAARLIAAAPELLEAVRRWISWCDDWRAGKPHPVDDLAFARAAIAKAEGKDL